MSGAVLLWDSQYELLARFCFDWPGLNYTGQWLLMRFSQYCANPDYDKAIILYNVFNIVVFVTEHFFKWMCVFWNLPVCCFLLNPIELLRSVITCSRMQMW